MSKIDCLKCGGTGQIWGGGLCDCTETLAIDSVPSSVHFIPKDYLKIRFDKEYVTPLDNGYQDFLDGLYKSMTTNYQIPNNLFISSPKHCSKQILAYSVLREAAMRGIEIFPIVDVGEVQRFLQIIDTGKTSRVLDKLGFDPEVIYTTPLLFVKCLYNPLSKELNALATLVDRRIRQNNKTIILSYRPWEEFTRHDYGGAMTSMRGDGTYGTIEIKHFGKTT